MSEEDVALWDSQHSLTARWKGEDGRSGMGRRRISAVVPVFNEEKTVSGVVGALLQSSLIDEVICADDGSTNGSLVILQALAGRIELIDLQDNRGKGHALAVGIKRASGEIVAFFDADLTNLSSDYVRMLLAPILRGSARAVLGRTVNWGAGVLPCGFAASPEPDVRYPIWGRDARNSLFDSEDVATIRLKGLRALLKHEKHGGLKAVQECLAQGLRSHRRLQKARLAGRRQTDPRWIEECHQSSDAEEDRGTAAKPAAQAHPEGIRDTVH